MLQLSQIIIRGNEAMKKCKFEQGMGGYVHNINKSNYEQYATPKSDYEVTDNGVKKAYAICPYCDNPIMLYGIVSTLEKRRSYGAHMRKNVKSFVYNESTFIYCPAYTGRRTVQKNDRRDHMEPINREIYNSLRNNFSSAIYILSQDMGIRLKYRSESLLRGYMASRAYMYYGATLYNIPWMLLYFSGEYINLWHSVVIEGSWIYDFLKERSDVKLVNLKNDNGKPTKSYQVEKCGRWLDLRLDFVEHKREYDRENDELNETIIARISTRDYGSKYMTATGEIAYHDKVVKKQKLRINEYRYPNLILSEKRIINNDLEQIAQRIIPELREE